MSLRHKSLHFYQKDSNFNSYFYSRKDNLLFLLFNYPCIFFFSTSKFCRLVLRRRYGTQFRYIVEKYFLFGTVLCRPTTLSPLADNGMAAFLHYLSNLHFPPPLRQTARCMLASLSVSFILLPFAETDIYACIISNAVIYISKSNAIAYPCIYTKTNIATPRPVNAKHRR